MTDIDLVTLTKAELESLESARVEAERQAYKLWLFISDAYNAEVFDCDFADRAHDLIEKYRTPAQ